MTNLASSACTMTEYAVTIKDDRSGRQFLATSRGSDVVPGDLRLASGASDIRN